jgi:hypothetical protein
MAVIAKEIADILPARERYIVDTSEFQLIQARLKNLKRQTLSATAQR